MDRVHDLYEETIEFLYAQLPMYQREGASAVKKNLHNSLVLSCLFGHPHRYYPTIHVAGTNGKGTVSHYIASILQSAGFRVGLYTSPHYVDFRERIKVNGAYISKADVVDFINFSKRRWSYLKPSFFELTVIMAFCYFRQQKVDVAVIETGLGGRLDSTNIIHPIQSVITNIGFDHMDMLGNTLEEIAFEKAGIIKPKVPIVIGKSQAEIANVFTEIAKSRNAQLAFADQQIKISAKDNALNIYYNKQLLGKKIKLKDYDPFTLENIITATASLLTNQYLNGFVSGKTLSDGIANMKSSTSYMGRWQLIQSNPTVIADSGHNKEAWIQSIQFLKKSASKVHLVIGFAKGKNPLDFISLIPKNWEIYACAANQPRALAVEDLMNIVSVEGYRVSSFKQSLDAYKTAVNKCQLNEWVFVGGSSYLVGEILGFLQQ